jgi:GNAT superfamily N-acetyltransferase
VDRKPGDRDFRVEPLDRKHDRAAFSCGNEQLDRYLKSVARQDVAKSVAAVYVATDDGKTIAGFYSLSQYSIDLRLLSEDQIAGLPRYPDVPVTLLGRLAVDHKFQGARLGTYLLADALKRALSIAPIVASAMVLVDAKDERTRRFYEAHGFRALREFPNRLVIPMQTIQRMTRE